MTLADLRDCEELILDEDETLWRQIHPKFERNGVVMFEGFLGTPEARNEVSISRKSVVTAEEAYDQYAQDRPSAGSWGVTISDLQQLDLRAIDDSGCDGMDVPGHGYIDMRDMTKRAAKVAREQLAQAATKNGREHP